MRAKTCSDACRALRARRREKERYERIKDTDHFKQTRADYLRRIAELMESDAEFADSMRENHRKAVRAWRKRQMSDPQLRAKYLEDHRERERARLERIRSDPVAHAEYLRKQREWYHSLSEEDYHRVFVAPRRQRKTSSTHHDEG